MIDTATRAYLDIAETALKRAKTSHIMYGNPAQHDIRYANTSVYEEWQVEGNILLDALEKVEALLKP